MKDRRLHQRFMSDVLDMHGKVTYAKVVRILDISVKGISLKTDRRPDVGTECILQLRGKGSAINVKSVVVWSLSGGSIKTPGGNSVPIYKTGLEFVNISREKIKEIVCFIKNHKRKVDKEVDMFAPSGSRQYVRLQIEPPEKIILMYRKGHKIKNLSLGGMLIENRDSFDIGKKLSVEIFRSKDKSMKVLGEVVSCNLIKESDHACYDVGIKFLGVPEKDREMLREVVCLLENMGFIVSSTLSN